MDQFEKAVKKAKRIGLGNEEKSQIRANLFAFLKMDVRKEVVSRRIWQRLTPVFASLLVLAVFGGGVSLAAENALPGDILYPIKVRFNEEVRAALALSAEAKTDWEVRRAERRIFEAEQLANRGQLNEETKARIEDSFEKHAQKAQEHVAKLESRIDAKLKEKVAILESTIENSFEASGKIRQRIEKAREKLKLDVKFDERDKGRNSANKTHD